MSARGSAPVSACASDMLAATSRSMTVQRAKSKRRGSTGRRFGCFPTRPNDIDLSFFASYQGPGRSKPDSADKRRRLLRANSVIRMEAHFASERHAATGADSRKKDVSDAFEQAPRRALTTGGIRKSLSIKSRYSSSRMGAEDETL